jgi:nitrate reductase gamma subunit
MLFFIGQIFPYIAVAVFTLGLAWRVWTWMKAPVPFQLTLFPVPQSSLGRIFVMGKEVLLFDSLRRGDKGLWFWVWLMHVTLAMVLVGHVMGIYSLARQFMVFGLTAAQSEKMSVLLSSISGFSLLITLTVLFYRRTSVQEVKQLSDPADYFELLLLLVIVITGLHMRTTTSVNLPAIREYLGSLIMLQPQPIPHESIFIWHFLLVNVLMIYFPFSKLVHMAGFVINRFMLLEAPPRYPTAAAAVYRPAAADAGLFKRRASL